MDRGKINFDQEETYWVEGGMIFPTPTEKAPHSSGRFFSKKLITYSDPGLRNFCKNHGSALIPTRNDELHSLLTPAWCRAFALENLRFSKAPGFLRLIRAEFSAHRFRKSLNHQKGFLTDRILNELFILHYFRLHCMKNRWAPTEENLKIFQQKTLAKPITSSPAAVHFLALKQLYSSSWCQNHDKSGFY